MPALTRRAIDRLVRIPSEWWAEHQCRRIDQEDLRPVLQVMDWLRTANPDRSERQWLQRVYDLYHSKAAEVANVRVASVTPRWGTFLFGLVRQFRPSAVIELGTAYGISSAYLAAALILNGEGGRLMTLEGDRELATQARKNLEAVGLAERVEVVQGFFQKTLRPLLDRVGTVDMVFIDGHHDEQATLTYTTQCLTHMPRGGVLVYDDIRWSAGMIRAWKRICERIERSGGFDFYRMGVLVVPPAGHSTRRQDQRIWTLRVPWRRRRWNRR